MTQLLWNIIKCRGKKSLDISIHILILDLSIYLFKITRNEFYYDNQLFRSIIRGLDKDMDGKVSILDFIKSLSFNYTIENKNIQVFSAINKFPYRQLVNSLVALNTKKKIRRI